MQLVRPDIETCSWYAQVVGDAVGTPRYSELQLVYPDIGSCSWYAHVLGAAVGTPRYWELQFWYTQVLRVPVGTSGILGAAYMLCPDHACRLLIVY